MTWASAIEIGLCLLLLLVAIRIHLRSYRDQQRWEATRRVRDRQAQEADPEGWARRQARQAHEAALVAAELTLMHRTSWYGRLWSWWRQRLGPQP